MIVLNEKRNGVNIIHIIIGPETDFHFNLNGQSTMDITEYIKTIPRDEKTVIMLNPCIDEQELLQRLAFEQGKSRMEKTMQEVMEKTIAQQQEQGSSEIQERTEQKVNKKATCPKCRKANSAPILDGKIYPCDSCREIDKHVSGEQKQTDSIPPPPASDVLKKIREELLNQNSGQKKSIRKFVDKKKDQDNGDNNIQRDTDGEKV